MMVKEKVHIYIIFPTFLCLVMSLSTPAYAAGDITAVREISNINVTPGETFNVSVTLKMNADVIGPLLRETLPDGWTIGSLDNDGSLFNVNTTEWAWVSMLQSGESKTVEYSVMVPDDTDDGVYTISGYVAPEAYNYITVLGDTQVTVSSETSTPEVIADFTANITSGKVPLTVKFTDKSTNATSWQWDFDGDNSIDSTEQNPVYTYQSAGTYTVKLISSSNSDSDVETKTDYITIKSGGGSSGTSLKADFTVNITSGQAPLSVQFTDQSSGNVSAWQWDFDGDNVIDSTEQDPVHTYTENGSYTVKLIVYDDDSNSDALTEVAYITVSDEEDDDSYNSYEATSVSLSATIIPSISIEVTPGTMNFGTLSAGEVSDEHTLHIKNKGATDATVTAQVTDVAKDLYVDGLMLNSGTWDGYSNVVESETTETVQASLNVPDDFIGIGSMEGKLVFWAEIS
ncbi:MAG: hypothetical protein PWQ75_183 [Methanolobus sp.]|jgi:PKD repeat protein|uniref:PKD domain-containing protein n=1 Tax=Methanolobus sp. TaxID=1874737 RepID=UPI00258C1F58|nr:PKD domain-containing protein [Methanolobus sp.]MDK2830431.1 hypothetical protein [Methanolobus sp.]